MLWGFMLAALALLIGSMIFASSLSYVLRHRLRDRGFRWAEMPCQLALCITMAFYMPNLIVDALGITEAGHQVGPVVPPCSAYFR